MSKKITGEEVILLQILSELKKLNKRTLKIWNPICIIIEVPNGTTIFTLINDNEKDFQFAFDFNSIELRSETNNLIKLKFSINSINFPSESFLIDASNNFKVNASHESYYLLNTESKIFPFRHRVNKPWKLQIYGINTHTETQKVYITFNGWRESEKNVI